MQLLNAMHQEMQANRMLGLIKDDYNDNINILKILIAAVTIA